MLNKNMYMYIVSVSRLQVRIIIAFVVFLFNWPRPVEEENNKSNMIDVQEVVVALVVFVHPVGLACKRKVLIEIFEYWRQEGMMLQKNKQKNKKVDVQLILVEEFKLVDMVTKV